MTPRPTLSRRQFLRVLAIAGASAGLVWPLQHLDWTLSGEQPLPVIHQSHLLMGTTVTLTLAAEDAAQAAAAGRAAVVEMRRLAGLFTRFDPASQLSRLNAGGSLASPDPALVAVLQQAWQVHQASGGAFDITVKPLIDLYETTQARDHALPSAAEIRQALRRVDTSRLVFDDRAVGFTRTGMSLTLDGIAKGAVIDAGVAALRLHGFANVIVEAGGDLLAAGEHGLETPWKIGLRCPRPDESLAMPALRIQDRSVATSGDYLQSFTADCTAHHILDPRQGVSAPELASATVIAPTAVLADALATALMVAGPRQGLEILARFPGCEAYLVDKRLQANSSPGFGLYLA